MDENFIFSTLSLIISVVGIITMYAKGYMSLSERVKTLEVKIDLFWGSIQSEVIKILHHPVTPRRDELLEKFDKDTITKDELVELCGIMDDIATSGNSKDQRIAALLIIGRINQLLYEPKKKKGWFK